MPVQPGWWDLFISNLGGGSTEMGESSLVSLLGGLGSAIAPQGSWQQNLGTLTSGIAQGKMTGMEMDKSITKREDMWAQLIEAVSGGRGMTEKGTAGPTTYSRTGDEVNIKGDVAGMGTDLSRAVTGRDRSLRLENLVPF
ncbi:hypothetical protein KAR91_34800 [Candidatus Pacearchaeota archaeon]|nr:hypothetical protein [Candidatus Pacearchaeota archaeon]